MRELDVRIGLVQGSTPDEERLVLRNRFRLPREAPDAIDVLLFSEVGSEGLDYQFCDCIVNYDLPWNPMRIEQRIGRIDRNGQRSETVSIYNLVTPGTIDFNIYQRCLLRIGVFNESIGSSEEILGQISREVRSVAENFTLTDAEQQTRLQQIADNHVRLLLEQQVLEEKQTELFGIRLPADKVKREIDDYASFWLAPAALENLVRRYLQVACGSTDHESLLGEQPVKTLRLSQEARAELLRHFSSLPRQQSPVYRDWENWLRGGKPTLGVTFDPAAATESADAVFVTPVHPLVRQAARALDVRVQVMNAFEVTESELPPGDHPYAIYQWTFHGVREDLTLILVSNLAIGPAAFLKLLERGTTLDTGRVAMPPQEVFDGLDSRHHQLWAEARAAQRSWTERVVTHKRVSLRTSHEARTAMLREQLQGSTDEKIRRMRASQIASAESDYARRMQDLELALTKADVTGQAVAFGIMRVAQGG